MSTRVGIALAVVLVASCRLGFDSEPNLGADDDGGIQIDADPLAPDANPLAPDADQSDAAVDAGPATATQAQSGATSAEGVIEDIAILPVLLSESFVTCSRQSTSSSPQLVLARCQLENETTLRIESDAADPTAVTSWTVLQVPGAVVQRGTVDFGTNDLSVNVPLTSVDRTRSFALLSTSSAMAGNDDDERSNVMINIDSDTSARLSRGATGVTGAVHYQIIQFPATTVQAGVVTMDNAVGSVNVVLANAVDLSRTFVVTSTSVGADVDGEEATYAARSLLTATDLTFTRRAASQPIEISWFAVELPAPSKVITWEGATQTPHEELAFEFSDSLYHEGMISFTGVEIDSGSSRAALGSATLRSVISGGKQRLERSVSDGSPLFYRSTAIDIVMPSGG